jgi:hypothetical protein
MTAIVPLPASRLAGANLQAGVFTAYSAADTFPAGPNTYLAVRNTTLSVVTVTVTPTTGSGPQGTTISALALAPPVEASTGFRVYGPFPQNPFGDASGNVNISYSTATGGGVQVAAYVFPGA